MTPEQLTALRIAIDQVAVAEGQLSEYRLYREADWCKVLGDRLEAVLKGEAHEVQG